MNKYEYKIYLATNERSDVRQENLNEYGEQGFKLVDVQLKVDLESYQYVYTLMKETPLYELSHEVELTLTDKEKESIEEYIITREALDRR